MSLLALPPRTDRFVVHRSNAQRRDRKAFTAVLLALAGLILAPSSALQQSLAQTANLRPEPPNRSAQTDAGFAEAFPTGSTARPGSSPPASRAMLGPASPFSGEAVGPSEASRKPGLRSLPPMQALPLQESAAGYVPDALTTPAYCDSPQLRPSATVRGIRFWDSQTGIAVGDHGSVLITRDAGVSWNAGVTETECRLSDAIWLDSRRVIAVGGGTDVVTGISRGVVILSRDAGSTWQSMGDVELPCLRTLHRETDSSKHSGSAGTLVAVGDPDPISGATRFESRDGGRNWQAVLDHERPSARETEDKRPINAERSSQWCSITGIRCVVRASHSLSEQTLLCAGDHGTIMRSTDRGKTWKRVHGGGRTAVLIVAENEAGVPWSIVGRESLENRLRTSVVLARRRDTPSTEMPSGLAKLEQAAMQLGAAAIDVSVLPMKDAARETQTIRRWVDVHRPAVLALDTRWPAEVKSAVTQFAVSLGTQRVVEFSCQERGETLYHFAALLPKTGTLAGDFREDAHLLLGDLRADADAGLLNGVAVTTLYSVSASREGGASLAMGAQLIGEHRLPQRVSAASRRRLQVVQGRLKQASTIEELFRSVSTLDDDVARDQFAASLDQLIDQTSRVDQFRTAWTIVRRALGTAQEPVAWQLLSQRFSSSSAGRLAALHASARQESREWKHHQWDPATGIPAGLAAEHSFSESESAESAVAPPDAELSPAGNGHTALVSPFQSPEQAGLESRRGVIQASATIPLMGKSVPGAGSRKRPGDAAGPQGELDLAWQMHPVRLLFDDAVERNEIEDALDLAKQTAAESLAPSQGPATDPSGEGGAGDLSADLQRIAQRKTDWSPLLMPDSRQVAVAARATRPPRLDGRLGEPMWSRAPAKPGVTAGRDELRLSVAWDDRFLYVAVTSRKNHFESPARPSEDLGKRDADLSSSDRIRLTFDTDRDLLTGFQLAFTRDGRTQDSLDGNRHWNPTWYVASSEQGGWVTSEIAIEREALTDRLNKGDRWLIRAENLSANAAPVHEVMPEPQSRIRVDFR